MARTMTGFPLCTHPKRDCCNVEQYGGCIALTKTDDFKRPCPFYLPWDKVKPEDRKYHASQLHGKPF